jgi:hypothetical protein
MKQVENPDRLSRFLGETVDLDWAPEQALASFTSLFKALNALAEAEVRYYYKRRVHWRWLSLAPRALGWAFGTAGALIPLLASTNPDNLRGLTPWGYVCLALAASFFAANSLFGGSSGHIRFATAQLGLERLITRFRLEWYFFIASLQGAPLSDEQITKALDITSRFIEDFYQVILAETGSWAEALLAEFEKYRQSVEKTKGAT